MTDRAYFKFGFGFEAQTPKHGRVKQTQQECFLLLLYFDYFFVRAEAPGVLHIRGVKPNADSDCGVDQPAWYPSFQRARRRCSCSEPTTDAWFAFAGGERVETGPTTGVQGQTCAGCNLLPVVSPPSLCAVRVFASPTRASSKTSPDEGSQWWSGPVTLPQKTDTDKRAPTSTRCVPGDTLARIRYRGNYAGCYSLLALKLPMQSWFLVQLPGVDLTEFLLPERNNLREHSLFMPQSNQLTLRCCSLGNRAVASHTQQVDTWETPP